MIRDVVAEWRGQDIKHWIIKLDPVSDASRSAGGNSPARRQRSTDDTREGGVAQNDCGDDVPSCAGANRLGWAVRRVSGRSGLTINSLFPLRSRGAVNASGRSSGSWRALISHLARMSRHAWGKGHGSDAGRRRVSGLGDPVMRIASPSSSLAVRRLRRPGRAYGCALARVASCGGPAPLDGYGPELDGTSA